MSVKGFVMHGRSFKQVGVRHSGTYGDIKLFDIGEEELIGAEYPDGSRQAQPLTWWDKNARNELHDSLLSRLPKPVIKRNGNGTAHPRITIHRPHPRIVIKRR